MRIYNYNCSDCENLTKESNNNDEYRCSKRSSVTCWRKKTDSSDWCSDFEKKEK